MVEVLAQENVSKSDAESTTEIEESVGELDTNVDRQHTPTNREYQRTDILYSKLRDKAT